jgi:hypothetical protein
MAILIINLVFIFLASGILVWIAYMFIGDWSGAPFVPVSTKILNDVLDKLELKPGKVFMDLGSGNGKVVFAAVKKYGIKGIGIELNPFLVWYCKIKAKITGIKDVIFIRENFWKTDISKADYIFVYLFNWSVEKLAVRFVKECKKGTLIISRAFEIKSLKRKLVKVIEPEGWKTYVYKV